MKGTLCLTPYSSAHMPSYAFIAKTFKRFQQLSASVYAISDFENNNITFESKNFTKLKIEDSNGFSPSGTAPVLSKFASKHEFLNEIIISDEDCSLDLIKQCKRITRWDISRRVQRANAPMFFTQELQIDDINHIRSLSLTGMKCPTPLLHSNLESLSVRTQDWDDSFNLFSEWNHCGAFSLPNLRHLSFDCGFGEVSVCVCGYHVQIDGGITCMCVHTGRGEYKWR